MIVTRQLTKYRYLGHLSAVSYGLGAVKDSDFDARTSPS